MDSNVYKILTMEEWENAQKNNLISTSLDNKDGFVHLSNIKQLAGTLALYFSDQDSVALLQIDAESVREALVYEKTKPGLKRSGEFPHFYGDLKISHISKFWILERKALEIPEEIILDLETS